MKEIKNLDQSSKPTQIKSQHVGEKSFARLFITPRFPRKSSVFIKESELVAVDGELIVWEEKVTEADSTCSEMGKK